MKILVTGGAGFIGSHIVDALIERGHNVFVVDNFSSGVRENVNPRAELFNVDIGDYEKMKRIFENNFEVVYHCAAQINVRKSVLDPVEDAKINILHSVNLLELCRKNKVKYFIFSSSGGAIYGDFKCPSSEEDSARPVSPYGCAKFSFEKYLDFYSRVYGLHYTSLRYSNVYGPRQNSKGEAGVVSIFIQQMFDNLPLRIYGGTQTRDFVYVDDVVSANLAVLNNEENEIYNVGTGIETDIIEIFSLINSFFKDKFKPEYLPFLKEEQQRSCLNYEKIKKKLGWDPKISLNEGLRKTYEWFKKRN